MWFHRRLRISETVTNGLAELCCVYTPIHGINRDSPVVRLATPRKVLTLPLTFSGRLRFIHTAHAKTDSPQPTAHQCVDTNVWLRASNALQQTYVGHSCPTELKYALNRARVPNLRTACFAPVAELFKLAMRPVFIKLVQSANTAKSLRLSTTLGLTLQRIDPCPTRFPTPSNRRCKMLREYSPRMQTDARPSIGLFRFVIRKMGLRSGSLCQQCRLRSTTEKRT